MWVNHPEVLNVASLKADEFWKFDARLTLDNPEDLMFIQALLRSADKPAAQLNTDDIRDLIQKYPELQNINNHIIQKGVDVDYVERIRELYKANSAELRVKLGHS